MMDRNREARRAALMTTVATNGGSGGAGFSKRRHRTGSCLRDSPEDDEPVELQETTARLRDRPLKKERDQLRERDRDRDRDRPGRSKRRRSDKFIGGGREDDGVDDSSEESVNDEDDDDPDDVPVRYVPSNTVPMTSSSTTTASSLTNHHPLPRKVYPPSPNKVLRPVVPPWKADEMIGVSIPRKARSASTKRTHETWNSGTVGSGEPIHRQASSSPVRSSVVSTQAASSFPAPMFASSSNASMKKKLKPNGQKQRPPKSYSKSSSSIQNEIEIEIEVAEVLYGLMRQSLGPAKQETATSDLGKGDSRETNNRSNGDSKSRVSSPISNSPYVHPQPSPTLPQNSNSLPAPLTTVAPKRKRPRAVGYDYEEEDQSSLVVRSGQQKLDCDQVPKHDGASPSNGKTSAESGGSAYDLLSSQARTGNLVSQMESVKLEHSITQPGTKAMVVGEPARRDVVSVKVEDAFVSTKELPWDNLDYCCIKDILPIGEKENHREDKLEIDLMAPPPQLRASSEEGNEPAEHGGGRDEAQKSVVANRGAAVRAKHPKAGGDNDDERVILEVACGGGADGVSKSNTEVKKPNDWPPPRAPAEEADTQKQINTGKNRGVVDLQMDLGKAAADKGPTHSGVDVEKLNTQLSNQPRPQKITKDDANADKNGKSSSLRLQLSVAAAAGWPGGLPPLGYVAPLQGVVSMDGTAIASAPAIQSPQFLFSQPRPKRCTTHCYVARNIQCHQQFIKMNPFWPAAAAMAAGSAPLFAAAKAPYNPNVVPSPADLNGNVAGRGINPVQDMGPALAFFLGQPGVKEKVPATAASSAGDGAKKNHFLLQQSLPPGPPANLLHGPAFIFPLGQQQVAAASASTSSRPSSVKSAAPPGSAGTSAAISTPAAAVSTAPTVPAMSFNFPSMPSNETQYLAILGNGAAYPFPIPAHVGAPPPCRGTHAQAMPFFNGSFYPPQILHPSQLQVQPLLQAHQNAGVSNAGASSHKHMQEQHKPQPAPAGVGNSNPSLQPSQTLKNRAAAQPTQPEMGGEDSPSTVDSCASRQNAGAYGPNFTLPIHPPNFFLTPAALAASKSGTADKSEKKQQQQQSHQSPVIKSGTESLAPRPFAMSFASMNGTSSGLDISTMAQNHPILQNLPEAARNNYQIMAAAAKAANQKMVYGPSDDGKAGACDSSHGDEEKSMAARASISGGHRQSLAFAISELPGDSASTVTGNNVVDSSARGLNLVSDPVRSSHPSAPSAISNASGSSSQQQQQKQQKLFQLQKQHQYETAAASATRGKTPTTGHGSVYTDQLSSSPSIATYFPNSLSGFPPPHVQNSGGTSHSSQWKNSRPPSSQVSSSSVAVLTNAAMKNIPQQRSRPQQSHAQISFGANPKSSSTSQAMQMPSNHQAPSPPGMVGSPSTSSISKGGSGSPRTTASASTNNKASQASGLSSHPGKNSSSVPSQKSSILGSPRMLTSTVKPQLQQSQHTQQLLQQPQLSKQAIQQTQLYFSNAYPKPSHNGSVTATASGYYFQRRRQDQQQQVHKSLGSAPQTTSGILSLSTVSLASAVTTDPAKAVAAAAATSSSMKGGVTSQGMLHSCQFSGQPPTTMHNLVSAGFPYVSSVPASAAVTVKPADQKQPVGSVGQPEKK